MDERGCRIVVGDDGVGYPPDMEWPKPGKISALIVHSLRQNAKATIDVQTAPGKGNHSLYADRGRSGKLTQKLWLL